MANTRMPETTKSDLALCARQQEPGRYTCAVVSTEHGERLSYHESPPRETVPAPIVCITHADGSSFPCLGFGADCVAPPAPKVADLVRDVAAELDAAGHGEIATYVREHADKETETHLTLARYALGGLKRPLLAALSPGVRARLIIQGTLAEAIDAAARAAISDTAASKTDLHPLYAAQLDADLTSPIDVSYATEAGKRAYVSTKLDGWTTERAERVAEKLLDLVAVSLGRPA